MTKTIPLSQNQIAVVDDEDFERVSQLKWHAIRIGNRFYVGNGHSPRRYLHRFLLEPPDDLDVDHINGDSLDNRRCNLRLATRAQNLINRGPRTGNASGYKGVEFHQGTKRWHPRIKLNGRRYSLGLFDDPAEAARVYDAKARELFGEFAWLNFPEEIAP